eukprot:9889191-Karenia_brevis.AAC.1
MSQAASLHQMSLQLFLSLRAEAHINGVNACRQILLLVCLGFTTTNHDDGDDDFDYGEEKN